MTKTKIMHIYGVIGMNGAHTDVSRTERGAKNHATRNGYTKISIRYNGGYHDKIIATKKANGRWEKVN